jgi:hypothetical protein
LDNEIKVLIKKILEKFDIDEEKYTINAVF